MAGATWFTLGVGLAIAQVLALWRTTRSLQPNRPRVAVVLFVVGFLGRSGAAAAVLLVAAKEGLGALLCALAGLWIARLTCIGIAHRSATGAWYSR